MRDPDEKVTLTIRELERGRSHSMCAGELSGLRRASTFLSNSAAQQFIAGNDKEANLLRAMSLEFKKEAEKVERTLDSFIKGTHPDWDNVEAARI
jgi:hypothetical protein